MAALLAGGADVNADDIIGTTPLSGACLQGAPLLAANADVNQASNDGHAAVHRLRGHTEIVAKLIAANANVNQATNSGDTPLFIATPRSSPDRRERHVNQGGLPLGHRDRREAARCERQT